MLITFNHSYYTNCLFFPNSFVRASWCILLEWFFWGGRGWFVPKTKMTKRVSLGTSNYHDFCNHFDTTASNKSPHTEEKKTSKASTKCRHCEAVFFSFNFPPIVERRNQCPSTYPSYPLRHCVHARQVWRFFRQPVVEHDGRDKIHS